MTSSPLRAAQAACLCSLALLAACGGGNGDPVASPPPPPPAAPANPPAVAAYLTTLADAGVSIPREIGDDRALVITDPATQAVTTYRGPKDGEGRLTALGRVETVDAQGRVTTVDYLDGADRLVTVDDRTTLSLAASDGGGWVLEFTDKASGTSFRTNLPATASASAAPATARPGRATILSATPVAAAGSRPDRQPLAANAAQIPVTVTTRNCGQTADALGGVRLTLNDGSGKFLGSYGTTRTGPGTYLGHIPDISQTTQRSLDTVKGAIETAAQVMSVACAADKASPLLATQACISVSAAMASTVIGAPVAAQFLAACEAAVVAGKLACAGYDKISLPVPDFVDPAAADILPSLDKILVKVLPDTLFNSTVVPYIEALPSNVYGASVAVTGTGAITASVDQEALVVGDLVLDPSNPAAGVSYAASARLQCIPFDSSATLAVSGSDGYTGSASKSWDTSTPSDVMQLSVPGAGSGVRDSLTLTVTPRVGSPVTRTAYLVFQ